MARLITSGFEIGVFTPVAGSDNNPDGKVPAAGGTPATDTTKPRSGARAVRCNWAVSKGGCLQWTYTAPALGTDMFLRVGFLLNALPSGAHGILGWSNDNGASTSPQTLAGLMGIIVDTTGKITIGGGTTGPTLNIGQYYCLELRANIGVGAVDVLEGRIDGVTFDTLTGLSLIDAWPTFVEIGVAANVTTVDEFFDDFALNNASGADQNSWCGQNKIVLLKPTADSAVGTGWTMGNATAIAANNAANALDNTPPDSAADLTAGADTAQIRNATANANVNYDATMQSYTTAGIGPDDVVKVVVPIIATGAPVTTSAKSGTVGVVSNPAIANVALGAGGTAGAFWAGAAISTNMVGTKWSWGTTTYNPVITKSTAPVMRVTQVTSSTRIAVVAEMYMYVEYEPHEKIAPLVMSQARARASDY